MTIKNKVLPLILVATGLAFASSQEAIAQINPRRAGIKGGLNASNLYVDNVNDENARLGVNAGLFGEIVSTRAFALQAELLFSPKGSKNVYDRPFFYQEIKYNLNYLDLPVLAVFKLGAIDLHLGGYASYLLNANIAYKGDLADGQDEIDKDNLKSYDYGLVGGIGINFDNMQVGARYNYGLVKISGSSAADYVLGNSKNSTAQLFAAFNLNRKK